MPQPGDIVLITGRCGAQFRGRQMHVRVSTVQQFGHTPGHLLWLAGYVLDEKGLAIERRPELLVEHDGLQLVERCRPVRQPHNAGPARIPQQRTSTTFRSNR